MNKNAKFNWKFANLWEEVTIYEYEEGDSPLVINMKEIITLEKKKNPSISYFINVNPLTFITKMTEMQREFIFRMIVNVIGINKAYSIIQEEAIYTQKEEKEHGFH